MPDDLENENEPEGLRAPGELLAALFSTTAPIVDRALEALKPEMRDRVVGGGRVYVSIDLSPVRAHVFCEAPSGELVELHREIGAPELAQAVGALLAHGLAQSSREVARRVAAAHEQGGGRLFVLVDPLAGGAACGFVPAEAPSETINVFELHAVGVVH